MRGCWHRLSVTLCSVALCMVSGSAVAAAADAAPDPVPERSVHELPSSAGVDIGGIQYKLGNLTPDGKLEAAILDQLEGYDNCDGNPGEGLRYFYDAVDLNDDGAAETIVFLVGSHTCGSGGCTTLIFQSDDETHQLMSRIVLVDNPIVVSDQTTNGWRDLILYVTGGGAEPAYHVLRHSGTTYPLNPSVAPILEQGTVVEGDAYIADEISFDTPAPVLRSRGCEASEVDLLQSEGFGDLRVDLEADRVVASLGDPDVDGEPAMSEADALFHQVWRYSDDGIVLDMVSESADGTPLIGSIQIEAPSMLKTRRGIGIGDTYAEVEEAYAAEGDPEHSDRPSTFVAGSIYGGLLFSFDGEDKVSRMLLGAAAE